MARYQDLRWYLGANHTPELQVPVLIRLVNSTKNHLANTPYRAVRVEAESVIGGTLYITWNQKGTPSPFDIDENNSFTYKDVLDWAYI